MLRTAEAEIVDFEHHQDHCYNLSEESVPAREQQLTIKTGQVWFGFGCLAHRRVHPIALVVQYYSTQRDLPQLTGFAPVALQELKTSRRLVEVENLSPKIQRGPHSAEVEQTQRDHQFAEVENLSSKIQRGPHSAEVEQIQRDHQFAGVENLSLKIQRAHHHSVVEL
jgi:hypothetical protein